MSRLAVVDRPPVSLAVTVHGTLVGRPASVIARGKLAIEIRILNFDQLKSMLIETTRLIRIDHSKRRRIRFTERCWIKRCSVVYYIHCNKKKQTYVKGNVYNYIKIKLITNT